MSAVSRVAALQLATGRDRDDVLEATDRLIAEAVGEGAGLIVLPELFAAPSCSLSPTPTSSCTPSPSTAPRTRWSATRRAVTG